MVNNIRSCDEKSVVLIADDSKMNLQVLSRTLEVEYHIIVAASGREGLELANKERPDLILLDIMMPDMDGYEVLRELKKSDETSCIPVIFISGLGSPEDESKGLFMGAVDYITKPFSEAVVRARVKTHVQIARQMRIIERLGLIDPLTEITNRRGFDHQLKTEWSRALRHQSNLSLLMIDVDNFKSFNDTYGHPLGDVVLQRVASVIERNLKRPTDIAARIGGEEFAVLLPDTDIVGAVAVGESIRTAVMNLNISCGDDAVRPITISLGAETEVPQSTKNSADFIMRCDKKLYASKKAGKNRLTYAL